ELGTDGGGELVGVSHAMTSSFAFPDTAHNAPRRNAEVIASITERPRGSSLAEMTRPAKRRGRRRHKSPAARGTGQRISSTVSVGRPMRVPLAVTTKGRSMSRG